MENKTEQKKRILAVSFGTSLKDARNAAIGGVEKALAASFPDYEVHRCFTSKMVISHIFREEGIRIDEPAEALQRAVTDHVTDLLVQPTHVMAGLEYRKFLNVLEEYKCRFESIRMGAPLLSEEEDFREVIEAVYKETGEYDDGKTAVILVGHGSESEADHVYALMQSRLHELGYGNYYVGTVESAPSAADICEMIQPLHYQRVLLLPLMVVAGDHALNDIGGDDGSWKQYFESAGYEVSLFLKGLGEYPGIQEIYVRHLRKAAETE